MGGFPSPEFFSLEHPGDISFCRECEQEYIECETRTIDGKTGLCAFCYEWAIITIIVCKIRKIRSPQAWARELLSSNRALV